MPPYAVDPNRVMWKYVHREVKRVHVDPQNGKSWRVDVVFTRVGARADTQERVEEQLETYTVAEKLGPNQAADLVCTVQKVCDQSYIQGYHDRDKRS